MGVVGVGGQGTGVEAVSLWSLVQEEEGMEAGEADLKEKRKGALRWEGLLLSILGLIGEAVWIRTLLVYLSK